MRLPTTLTIPSRVIRHTSFSSDREGTSGKDRSACRSSVKAVDDAVGLGLANDGRFYAIVMHLLGNAAQSFEGGDVAAKRRRNILMGDQARPDQAAATEHEGGQPHDPGRHRLVSEDDVELGKVDLRFSHSEDGCRRTGGRHSKDGCPKTCVLRIPKTAAGKIAFSAFQRWLPEDWRFRHTKRWLSESLRSPYSKGGRRKT
jgi:hypothetical protein